LDHQDQELSDEGIDQEYLDAAKDNLDSLPSRVPFKKFWPMGYSLVQHQPKIMPKVQDFMPKKQTAAQALP